jgi:hypothetical protein
VIAITAARDDVVEVQRLVAEGASVLACVERWCVER